MGRRRAGVASAKSMLVCVSALRCRFVQVRGALPSQLIVHWLHRTAQHRTLSLNLGGWWQSLHLGGWWHVGTVLVELADAAAASNAVLFLAETGLGWNQLLRKCRFRLEKVTGRGWSGRRRRRAHAVIRIRWLNRIPLIAEKHHRTLRGQAEKSIAFPSTELKREALLF